MSNLLICDDSIQGAANVDATQRKEVRKVSRTRPQVAYFRCDINALWAESAKPSEIFAEPRAAFESRCGRPFGSGASAPRFAPRDFLHEPTNSPCTVCPSATRRHRVGIDAPRCLRPRRGTELPDHAT